MRKASPSLPVSRWKRVLAVEDRGQPIAPAQPFRELARLVEGSAGLRCGVPLGRDQRAAERDPGLELALVGREASRAGPEGRDARAERGGRFRHRRTLDGQDAGTVPPSGRLLVRAGFREMVGHNLGVVAATSGKRASSASAMRACSGLPRVRAAGCGRPRRAPARA